MALVQRITRAIVAAAAFAVAAGVAVVAASYALYALLRDPLGPAGAAGVVAAVAAIIVLAVGLLVSGKSKPKDRDEEEPGGDGLQARLLEVARGHPMLAIAAVVAGAFVLARRPGLLALLAANILGAKRQKHKDRRDR